jgi:protoporphyrinogen oxidase
MTSSRRDFLKFVVAGSVAAGCPVDLSLLASPASVTPAVDGDRYDVCHQVRDGHAFARPPVSKRYDVVIVGGGVSGLSAAYFLRQHNFLLLEKEPHWGGNAYLEEYEGQAFSTGSAFAEKDSEAFQLANELGLKYLPISSPDPTIVAGKWVKDTWGAGLDELPYPVEVRESFKKFRAYILTLDTQKRAQEFDNDPFTKYLKGYAPEIKQWWDAYGPSNWGAKSEDTSALIAIQELQYIAAGGKGDPRVTLPGGNGALSRRLSETLAAKYKDQMQSGATIVGVAPQKDEVAVTFVQDGELHTMAAKFVVMATPKFITSRIVDGLPDAQKEAMFSFRYCPYPVINMIFDKPVYTRAYDTWCPGNSFTDFIVADWVLRSQPGYTQRSNILTFYTPLGEIDRGKLLKEDTCRQIALNVLRDFQKLLPEFNVDPVEVHLYRRGHPMFMPTPGTLTNLIPAASKPLDRVFFANTDSIGPVSDVSNAILASKHASEWVENRMAGASASAAQAATGSSK